MTTRPQRQHRPNLHPPASPERKRAVSDRTGEGHQPALERHGGFGVVMEKIVQREQENPASNGREMSDDFCLRGSRTWRRMGDTATKGGWRTQVVHDFGNYKSALSEGEALAVVVQAVPENPHWTWVGTNSPNPQR